MPWLSFFVRRLATSLVLVKLASLVLLLVDFSLGWSAITIVFFFLLSISALWRVACRLLLLVADVWLAIGEGITLTPAAAQVTLS